MDSVKKISLTYKINIIALVIIALTYALCSLNKAASSDNFWTTFILFSVIVIVLFNLISNNIRKPLLLLQNSVKKNEETHKIEKITYSGNDEYAELINSYNLFADRVSNAGHSVQTLFDILNKLVHEKKLENTFQILANGAKELLKTKYAAFAIFQENSSKTEKFYYSGMTESDYRRIGRLPEGKGLLGYIHETKQILRLDNMQSHPKSYGFPSGHPSMKTLLASPIVMDGKSLGNIYVSEKNDTTPFSIEDENLFKLFSVLCGFIIQQKISSQKIEDNNILLQDEVRNIHNIIEKIETGDLTLKIDESSSNTDIKNLKSDINKMSIGLNKLLSEIESAVYTTASAGNQISASAEHMEEGSRRQNNQSLEIVTAIEEMTKSIMDNSRNATAAVEAAKKAGNEAEQGGIVVQKAITGMNKVSDMVITSANNIEELGKNSNQIGDIIQTIEEIADQTNLLALNAAIEAARAGEQGRGFAVVADEVRKLAERTTKATKEISEMIKKIQADTTNAVSAMRQGTIEVESGKESVNMTGIALQKIITEANNVSDIISQVAAANEQQSRTSDEIASNIENIKSVTHESTQGIHQIVQAVDDLSRLTNNLQNMISYFKLR